MTIQLLVHGGRTGGRRAADEGHVAVVVDALRASTTTTSLLHYGVREIIVVEDLQEAQQEALRHPGCWSVGERHCLPVEGFNLGNSPLQKPVADLPHTVVFTSSNMSRCCVEAARAPAVFLGTLANLTCCAHLALEAAQRAQSSIMLIPAGAAEDETVLTVEDYIAAGAIIEKIREIATGTTCPANDAAGIAVDCHRTALERGLERSFVECDNGRYLQKCGYEADVRFASQKDTFCVTPHVFAVRTLPSGAPAACLKPACGQAKDQS